MPDRTGNACVAAGTWVWRQGEHDIEQWKIEEIPVVWDQVRGVWNDDLATVKPIKSPFSDELVYPIWRLGGPEENPMVNIPVTSPGGNTFMVSATEWHPVIKQDPIDGRRKIVPADFVRTSNNVYIHGPLDSPVPTGPVTSEFNNRVEISPSPHVYGLGLASREFFDLYVSNLSERSALEQSIQNDDFSIPFNWRYVLKFFDGVFARFREQHGERIGTVSRSNPLGLDLIDHVLLTNDIVTGAITMQYLMVKKLEEGLAFEDLACLVNSG